MRAVEISFRTFAALPLIFCETFAQFSTQGAGIQVTCPLRLRTGTREAPSALPVWPVAAVVSTPQACDVVALARVCVEVLRGNPLSLLGDETNASAERRGLVDVRGGEQRWPLAAEAVRAYGKKNKAHARVVPDDAWAGFVRMGAALPSADELKTWVSVNRKIMMKRGQKELVESVDEGETEESDEEGGGESGEESDDSM